MAATRVAERAALSLPSPRAPPSPPPLARDEEGSLFALAEKLDEQQREQSMAVGRASAAQDETATVSSNVLALGLSFGVIASGAIG